jgi:NAD(P)-dependent dehydrogenase (short-subunit alcohol dehydrogenase family)
VTLVNSLRQTTLILVNRKIGVSAFILALSGTQVMRKLEGKIALITGASRGIGRSVALAFAREGAYLFLVGHVDQRSLEDTSRLTRETGADVQAGLFDVGNYDDVCRIADRIAAHFGTLDIVVNNAGTIKPCVYRKLDSAILVVKATENWV